MRTVTLSILPSYTEPSAIEPKVSSSCVVLDALARKLGGRQIAQPIPIL
jgi:hypothetical protein